MRDLILRIFSAANIVRWNDKMRPMDFSELDKQAHKMVIAYLLGRLQEEQEGNEGEVNWIDLIEGGIFELLQRIVLTDIKPQIYYEIRDNREQYRQLNEWVCSVLKPTIAPLGAGFVERFHDYFLSEDETLSRRILSAAHFYATKWEFQFIERENPGGYEIADIKADIEARHERYYDLKAMRDLILYPRYRNFVDLCGELRFQTRWAHVPRVPKTSVLGHMLVVAILTYLFSMQMRACRSRCVNNYLNGLFHDLPEALTRDIISPVKRSTTGFPKLLKQYEKREMKKVYQMLGHRCRLDLKRFTEKEFRSSVVLDGKEILVDSSEISRMYNADKYDPRDGELVEAVDALTAFVEVHLSIKHGITGQELVDAMNELKRDYARRIVAGVDFGQLYRAFDSRSRSSAKSAKSH